MRYLFIILLALSAEAQTLQPGRWQSESQLTLKGIPFPASRSEVCITAEESKNPKKTIEDALTLNECQLLKWDMKKKTVTASVSCKNDMYEATGNLTGEFDKKKYKLSGTAKGVHQIIGPAEVDIVLKGEWKKACP